VAFENGDGIESIGVGDPADPARSEARESPGDAVVVAERRFFCGEKADEFPADVAEADERKIESANWILLGGAARDFGRARTRRYE
jgi:hypothetical protein